jgi:DNA-binding MarR family transcriptional regulator
MAAEGLVERHRPQSRDRRSTMAVLTKRGFSALRRAWPHHIRSVRAHAFDHLTVEETAAFGIILERLAEQADAPQ